MSKLQKKIQTARKNGVVVLRTENLLSKSLKVRYDRRFANVGEYCVYSTYTPLLYPLGGLTYREAVNMAYEIAVNPNSAFKEEYNG